MADGGPISERDLFEACLDRPVAERLPYLYEACQDAELRERVERLLDAYARARDSSTIGIRDLALEEAEPETVGPYKIIQTLGEGGMGVVYEAEQTEPVRRRVALKLIKLGMDTRQVVARFEAERQALAVMDHPYIAKVLDAGATADGRPFFVMELVRGVPLREYCDRHGLATRERLELFVLLCQAIQHAHQKGVIHRDLKPSNVLVSVDEDRPIPRVIDFGIAKAVGHQLTDATIVTLHGQAIGTPAYMSPEQAGVDGLDVDTRTDVYSLGVMLYELLVGALPIDPVEVGVPEFLTRLARMETDPPVPSARLEMLADRGAEAAQLRTTDPAHLKRQLKGDLDWIVMRAVEKERSRRYPTVNALAEDIRRFLADQTVNARPPTTTYRVRKFVRRNRAGVAAASVALFAILAGSVAATAGFIRATRAEAEARREAETARQVSDFLVRMFEMSDPGESRGETVTARELLTIGKGAVDRELQGQPAVQARLLDTLSRVHRSLGLYDDAAALAERALAIREGPAPADELELAETLVLAGAAYGRLSRHEEARQALERSLEIRRARLGGDAPEVAATLDALATLEWRLDHLDEALELNRRALEIRERRLGPGHTDVAYSLRGIGHVLNTQDKNEEARPYYERAQAILEANLAGDHPAVADNLDSLGIVREALGHYDESRDYHLRALEIRERALGKEHPTVAYSMLNVGRLHVSEGKPEEALPYYLRGIAIREAALGENHSRTADIIESAAICYAMLGDLEQTQQLMERTNRIYEKAFGPDHWETFESRRNLAIAYTMRGRRKDAMRLLRLAAKCGRPVEMNLADSAFNPLRDDPEFQALALELAEARR